MEVHMFFYIACATHRFCTCFFMFYVLYTEFMHNQIKQTLRVQELELLSPLFPSLGKAGTSLEEGARKGGRK